MNIEVESLETRRRQLEEWATGFVINSVGAAIDRNMDNTFEDIIRDIHKLYITAKPALTGGLSSGAVWVANHDGDVLMEEPTSSADITMTDPPPPPTGPHTKRKRQDRRSQWARRDINYSETEYYQDGAYVPRLLRTAPHLLMPEAQSQWKTISHMI